LELAINVLEGYTLFNKVVVTVDSGSDTPSKVHYIVYVLVVVVVESHDDASIIALNYNY